MMTVVCVQHWDVCCYSACSKKFVAVLCQLCCYIYGELFTNQAWKKNSFNMYLTSPVYDAKCSYLCCRVV